MLRSFVSLLALTLMAVPCRGRGQGEPPEILIRLAVAPADAPKPALKYMLLPGLDEISPGNPVQNYLKCAFDEYHYLFGKEEFDRREKLLAMPLEVLPVSGMREIRGSALASVDRAARLENPDWQILLKLKADGISTLLPDVQQMRSLARAMQPRFRGELATGRFDDAIRSAKTMFAMARHMGEHPTLIGDLVGIAIAGQAIVGIEEMLEQPACPNLYWAIANLPDPLVPCEQGAAGERLTISTVFNDLNSERPMTLGRAQAIY